MFRSKDQGGFFIVVVFALAFIAIPILYQYTQQGFVEPAVLWTSGPLFVFMLLFVLGRWVLPTADALLTPVPSPEMGVISAAQGTVYRLGPEGQAAVRSQVVRRMGLMGLGMSALILFVPVATGSSSPLAEMITRGVILVLVWGSLFYGTRRALRQALLFEIVVAPDRVTRHMANVAEMTIHRDEVTAIEEHPGEGLVIKTAQPQRQLGITANLEGYAMARSQLAAWAPIQEVATQKGPITGGNMATLTIIASLIAFGLIFFSQNPLIIIPLGLGYSVFLGWTMVATYRNPHLDVNTRRRSWVTLVPLVAILVRMAWAVSELVGQ